MIVGEWVPGHPKNLGNDEADRLAKFISKLLSTLVHGYTYAAIKVIATTQLKKHSNGWWNKHAPLKYRRLGITFRKNPRELFLARSILSELIAARSGHGNFMKYHVRFHHLRLDSYKFGLPKSPEHFFFCRNTRNRAQKGAGKRRTKDGIDWLLGTERGVLAFATIWTGET